MSVDHKSEGNKSPLKASALADFSVNIFCTFSVKQVNISSILHRLDSSKVMHESNYDTGGIWMVNDHRHAGRGAGCVCLCVCGGSTTCLLCVMNQSAGHPGGCGGACMGNGGYPVFPLMKCGSLPILG